MKKYAFLPGAVMAVAGVVWAAVALTWNAASITLGVGGVLACGVGLSLNWKEIREWFRDPRGVFAVNTTFSALLLVAILGLVNASTALRPVKFDLTASGRNTLATETRTLLARLTADVSLKQFGRTPDPKVDDLLRAFAGESQHLKPEFVDAEKSIQQAREYGVLKNGTVVVDFKGKFRKIEQVTETSLVTAILQVTSTVEPMVCVAQGDGERGFEDDGSTGLSQLVTALKASNYRTSMISLLEGDAPRVCNVLLVAGVEPGFGAARIDRVNRFFLTGGRVVFTIDPPVASDIVAWLRPYGVGVGSGIIIDNSPSGRQVGSGPEMPLGVSYNSHPITRGFNIATIYDRAVPLTVERQEVGIPVPLVATGAGSFERIGPAGQQTPQGDGREQAGKLTLAIAVTAPRASQAVGMAEPRLVVFGDSDWLTNSALGRQGNRDLALRVVAWLAGEEEAHIVASGDRENRRITMTEKMRTTMYLVNLLFLPLIPFVAGVIHLLRSRK